LVEIKEEKQLLNIQQEHDLLHTKLTQITENLQLPVLDKFTDLAQQLQTINNRLWKIEDDIRDQERRRDFGPAFIALARSVYYTNDDRSRLKRAINDLLNSTLIEEKSYTSYS
jgi:3-methyladenine DNA glycosylase/8-oxoguanine DNA glycosylase